MQTNISGQQDLFITSKFTIMKTFKLILAICAFVIFATCENIHENYINLPGWNTDSILNYIDEAIPDDFNITYSVTVEGDCNFVGFYFDEPLGEISICNGDSLPEITSNQFYYEGCLVREVFVNGDLLFSDTLCPEVTHDTITNVVEVHHQSAFWDFNTGDTHTHEAIGFANLNASESQGTNRYHFNTNPNEVLAWTKYPVFGHSSNLDSVSLKWGSVWEYFVEIIEESYSGKEKVLYEKIVKGDCKFNAYDATSYKTLDYSFPKGNYSGKRLMIKVSKINTIDYPSNPTRNQEFNINEIYYSWSWIE